MFGFWEITSRSADAIGLGAKIKSFTVNTAELLLFLGIHL